MKRLDEKHSDNGNHFPKLSKTQLSKTQPSNPLTPHAAELQRRDLVRLQILAGRFLFVLILILAWFAGILYSILFPQEIHGADWMPKNDPHRPQRDWTCECILQRTQEYQAYLKERQQKINGKTYGKSRLIKNYPPFKTQTCSGAWQAAYKRKQQYEQESRKQEQQAKAEKAAQAAQQANHLLPTPRRRELDSEGTLPQGSPGPRP